MARGRYSTTPIIDNHHYATFSLPVLSAGYRTLDLLEGVQTFPYTVKQGDRLDNLSFKFFNDAEYAYLLALCNNIKYYWDIRPGDVLQIPFDKEDVLDKLFP